MDDKYLEYVLTPLLTKPDELVIVTTRDDMGVLFTIRVSQEDMGFIIGVNGDNIKTIRTLMHLYGSKKSAHISLKILEPDEVLKD